MRSNAPNAKSRIRTHGVKRRTSGREGKKNKGENKPSESAKLPVDWNISAIYSGGTRHFCASGGISSADASTRASGRRSAREFERAPRGCDGDGATTGGTSRRTSRATARDLTSNGVFESGAETGGGRGGEGEERGPPCGVEIKAHAEYEACGATPSVRDLGRSTAPSAATAPRASRRPAHNTYLRVPSIARIVQNHAPTIAGPQCTASRACENCGWEKTSGSAR